MRKIILISVLLNLGLVGALAYFATQQKKSFLPAEPVTETKAENKARIKSKQPREKVRTLMVDQAAPPFDWRQVESADYKEYIAHLRRVRCPEETIRDIIMADLDKFYAEQLKPLRKPPQKYRYWRNDQNWGGRRESDEFAAASKRIEKEKRALLKELLDADDEELMAQRYGGNKPKDSFTESLSKETKEKISEIAQKFGERQGEIYRKAKGYIDEDTQLELRQLEKQQRAELAKVLSPEELFEWQVRNSQVARDMKWNELEGFNANEDEFRSIFTAKLALSDAQTKMNSEMTPEERDAQSKVRKEKDDELKKFLGEDRYKEYEMNQQWDYRELRRIAGQQDIAKEDVQKVYGMKDDVQKAARAINADKNLSAEEKRAKLLEIKAATEKEVTSTLGDRGYKQWKRNAWWLRNIIPPEPTHAP